MPFDPGFEPPAGLTADDFILRPITVADAENDYAAVMESREYLRGWEQSTWPADDFTVAGNLEDMEKLERRHANRESFTYTVTNPAGTECLGCVYVMPPDAGTFLKAVITPVGDHRWEDYDAAIYFWVRKSQLAKGLDRVLLDRLRSWFVQEWKLPHRLIVTNEQFAQQVALIEETDLRLEFTIAGPGQPGRYLGYA